MSKDKNQNDTPLDAEISGAVAALSSMKETLDQMVDPTLPDTVNDAMMADVVNTTESFYSVTA